MAWYPEAQKLELQPESDSQAAIAPTQFILHSIAAPWTPGRIYEYWRDSTNLESHFGLGYDGSLAQFIGTQTRADANMYANRRSDGTGAVSLESASNLQHTDPWTPEQVAVIIRLGVWLHQQHGIPLRVCRSATDPGFGYHRLFPEWSDGGTACPGDARVQQFHDVIMPGISAAAAGQIPPTPKPAPAPAPAPSEEDDMPISDADVARISAAVASAVGDQKTRDAIAYAVDYKLGPRLDALPNQVWEHQVPVPRLQPDGSVTYAAEQSAYWPLVWGNVWNAQVMAAIAAAALTPAEVQQALADGTLHVTVTVAPATSPKES
ncbi:N-acetylmuramoyl-L-alanine amidase [Kitasatospora sp. NPDC005751]|uniref:peptidoglycan recognition protein family protein n=1 Tax=Kitasatospora sp. NPDC005751 TaxID=3157064 RepID=UPI0034074C98